MIIKLMLCAVPMPAVGSMNQNMNFLYGAAGKKFRGEGATVHSKKAYQELELWFP